VIEEFIIKFTDQTTQIREAFAESHPGSYTAVVKIVIEAISADEDYDTPDPERIHVINDGDYQGTLLFVIAGKGYQPSDYWYVKVGYGSCSGCDTLEGIRNYDYDDTPTLSQVDAYYTLALHVVQGLKPMQDRTRYG
jgi:hypothetical protein